MFRPDEYASMPRPPGLFWLLQLGGWTLFGAGMLAAGTSLSSFPDAVVLKVPLTVLGFAVSLLLREIYRAFERRALPPALSAILALPISAVAAALWMAAYHVVLASLTASRRGDVLTLVRAPDFTNTIYYSFVLVAWSVLYFGVQSYVSLVSQQARLARAEALAQEARLKALRLQLDPHFLFNTLNAISTLVAESRSEEANRMLARLGAFLRATLDRTDDPEISLDDEVDFARRYLEIEEIRFGDRLRVSVDLGAGSRNALVPSLILQPLVENAVRHAVLPREGGPAIGISIHAERRDGWVTLAVDDDGPGMDADRTPHGVGLANTRQRLAELYGGRAELVIGRREGGGLSASIRLPFRAAGGPAS